MLPEIVFIKKSIERRLAEYKFLGEQEEPCCKAYTLWGEVLEYTFGHISYWKALWRLSEENCIRFKALHPMAVVVSVQELIVENLSAAVTVEGTQEDISFPEIIDVPIFELFPLKQQSVSSGTITRIADTIDQCRFFFLNLWYPWDNMEDVSISEWSRRHLENRLKLQYDILNGVLGSVAAQHVKSLMTEALEVADALESFDEEPSTSDCKLALVKNLQRKESIQLKLSLYENPELRETMIKLLYEEENLQINSVGLVLEKCTLASAASVLKMASSHLLKNEEMIVYHSAKEAVKNCKTVLLSPGNHKLMNLGHLALERTLKGLGRAEDTIISPIPTSPPRYTFMVSLKNIFIQNITIERSEGVILSAFNGVMRLDKCILRGSEDKVTNGVVVMKGCRLELVDCELYSLGTAFIVKEGATASLNSCRIRNCAEGMKIMDNSSTQLTNVQVESCSTAGILVQTSENGKDIAGSIDILSNYTPKNWSISFSECKFTKNTSDSLIVRMPQEDIYE